MFTRLMHLLFDFIIEDLRPFIREAREYLRERRTYLLQQRQPEPEKPERLFDAKYAEDRIGVGDKTIYRLTKKGELPVACHKNRKRQFKESDIEKCRRLYGRD